MRARRASAPRRPPRRWRNCAPACRTRPKISAAGISPAELDALQKRIAALEQSAKAARADIAKASSADIAARLALSAAALARCGRERRAVCGRARAGQIARRRRKGFGAARAVRGNRRADGTGAGAGTARAAAGHAEDFRRAGAAKAASSNGCRPMPANWCAFARSMRRPATIRPRCWRASKSTPPKPTSPPRSPISASSPMPTRAPAQDWIEKAKARQAALAAARQFAADTARALGPR